MAPGGDDDDGDRLQLVVRPQLLQHLDPGEARQHHVEHDQLRRLLAGERERLDAVRRLDEAVAGSEHGPDELTQARVVVADENRRGAVVGCGLLCSFVHRWRRGGGSGLSQSSHALYRVRTRGRSPCDT